MKPRECGCGYIHFLKSFRRRKFSTLDKRCEANQVIGYQ